MAEELQKTKSTRDTSSDARKFMNHPLIRYSDMDEDIKLEAVELTVTALERFPTHYENASRAIKEGMDKKTGGGWQCVIGEGYGFEVTHELKTLLFLYFSNLAILLFKCV
eukprot:Phypoly_transcript_26488.p1 GENE.Phypoly_transcript_26488~~Phypoly_transcript_26488.p1  ORF type:complete len:110 (+),score=12.31 Phypoly_transcript_26488:82-411(+)